jgi:hypothetical protein
MTTKPFRWQHLFLSTLLLLLIHLSQGCGARLPVTYYNLTPEAPAHEATAASGVNGPLAIGVGPVVLPEALSRAQIALRLDGQRLRFDDGHRWGNPLADDFAQVLMDDIASRLPTQTRVTLFPWGNYFRPTHRIVVNVSLFDGSLAGEVQLRARWTITNGTGKETITARQSAIKVKVAGGQYQDLVAAQSRAVADLASEMAAALTAQ